MSTTNVTFRIDDKLKKEADELFADLGMSLSTAFNIFIRQAVREQKIPFVISREIPNAKTIAAIKSADNEIDIHGPYNDVSEVLEALNADD